MPVIDYANMPVELRDGFRVLNEWVHELEFEPELLCPGDFIPDGNSVHAIAAVRWASVNFPAAPASSAFCQIIPRSHWIDGNLQFTILYSGSASSINTINWEVLSAARSAGENLGSHDIQSVQAMAGPATLNDIIITSFTTQLAVNSLDDIISLRISRTTPDAYAGTAYMLGVKLTYIPNKL
jgi:hypothetical protein